MLKCSVISIVASALLVTGLGLAPAQAGGLLGGITDTVSDVTDTVTDTVGDLTGGGGGGGVVDTVTDTVSDLTGGTGLPDVTGELVTVNNTSNTGVVNLNTNGSKSGLTASVGKTNKGLPSVNVTSGLLKTVLEVLDLSGLGLDLTIDLGILNPGTPTTGGPSNPPRPGDNGVVLVGSLDGGNTFVINCTVNNTRQVLQVAANGKIDANEIKAWQRSANVQIVPIKLCPAARKQVAAILSKSQKMNLLQRAVMADALISASLGRTRYDAGDVVAVQRKGGQLVVYVY